MEWEVTVEELPESASERFRSEGHTVDHAGPCQVIRVREAQKLQEMLRGLTKEGVFIHSVEPRRQSLEEHFVRAIQEDAGSGAGRS